MRRRNVKAPTVAAASPMRLSNAEWRRVQIVKLIWRALIKIPLEVPVWSRLRRWNPSRSRPPLWLAVPTVCSIGRGKPPARDGVGTQVWNPHTSATTMCWRLSNAKLAPRRLPSPLIASLVDQVDSYLCPPCGAAATRLWHIRHTNSLKNATKQSNLHHKKPPGPATRLCQPVVSCSMASTRRILRTESARAASKP